MDVEKTVVKMERKAGGPLQIEVRSRSSLEPRQSLSVDATPSPQGATSAELTPREKAMQEEVRLQNAFEFEGQKKKTRGSTIIPLRTIKNFWCVLFECLLLAD